MEGFMSVTLRKRRKEPQVNYRKMKDLLQMMEKTLGPQGLAPSLKTLAIILDFSRNVKRKNT